ncbi:MAG: hypothetical protein HY720_28285, partial [Planctomycetes bacterium]|nr:hypothetical protein [Planctomycetota bacterium]
MRYVPLAGVILAAGLGVVWLATRSRPDPENPDVREERAIPHSVPPGASSLSPLRRPIDFPVLYVRMPRGGDVATDHRVEAGGKLALRRLDGSHEVLFDPGPLATAAEPSVSFDARQVAFTIYSYDAKRRGESHGRHPRESLQRPSHADIHVLDLATGSVRQLTFQDKAPGRGVFNSGPCWVAPDRILFTSTRTGYRDGDVDQLHLMDSDGGGVELVGHMNLSRAASPVALADGRVAWTGWEDMGLGSEPELVLWSSNPDGSDARSLSGDLASPDLDFRSVTELAGGDLVFAASWVHPKDGTGVLLRIPGRAGGDNTKVEILATGKFAHPAGAPGGDLLVTCSDGPSGAGIYLLPEGRSVTRFDQMIEVADSSLYDEIWPRPLVPWSDIHGRDAPPVRRAENDGATHAALPPGTPLGIVGGRFTELAEEIYGVRLLAIEPAGGPQAVSTALAHREVLRILAEIPIRKTAPDGSLDTSWLARIPADTPFTLQTIDRYGMALGTNYTRYQVRPGEARTDFGGRQASPGAPVHEAASLTSVEFFRDVVPIFKASCVPCHSGTAPEGGLHLDTGAWQNFPARRDVLRNACALCHSEPDRRPLEDEGSARDRAYAYQDILAGGKPLYDLLLAGGRGSGVGGQ